MFACQLSKSG